MACARCGQDRETNAAGWCTDCDRAFDAWSRRYASDILYAVFGAGVIVMFAGIGLPLLGVPWLVSATGIFAGFGTIIGFHRWNRNRRRRQYLAGAAMPRAYLPEKS